MSLCGLVGSWHRSFNPDSLQDYTDCDRSASAEISGNDSRERDGTAMRSGQSQ
jgi:hypothetical protein